MEWANRKQRLSVGYAGPLLLDIGCTYVGYAPLFVPLFLAGLLRSGLPQLASLVIGHLGVLMLAMWLAYYPEQNLVGE